MRTEQGMVERIQSHQYFASIWAILAKDAVDKLNGTHLHESRDRIEKFIQRCISRSLRHFREAERARQAKP